MPQNARDTHDIDVYAGKKLRELRITHGYSQEKLAKALGVTFQQVQKYERGANRMVLGRLYEIAKVFGVPIATFVPDDSSTQPNEVNTRTLYLVQAYQRLSPREQAAVSDLVNTLAGQTVDAQADVQDVAA